MTEIERQRAEEQVLRIEGVGSVDNQLQLH